MTSSVCLGVSFKRQMHVNHKGCRLRLKCNCTRTETKFRLSAKWTVPFKSARASVLAGQLRTSACGFVLLVRACVLLSCDGYWLPTPFSFFPFTSPPLRHCVPSHFNWNLLPFHLWYVFIAFFLFLVSNLCTCLLCLFIFLYMFRAILCSSSGDSIVYTQHLVPYISLFLGDCSVHRLLEDSLLRCT